MLNKIKHIHFTGIGGIGMSGIAEVLFNLGYKISGSDLKRSDVTDHLKKIGIKICFAHKKENINGSDVVVYSSAISADNPEIIYAHRQKIPVIPRAEMLAELMRLKYSVAVAGTHGKTTTSSMAAYVLAKAGLRPTVIIGGKLKVLKGNAKLGTGEYLVAEADESDGSFLHLSPTITIVTNIDNDHLDHYGTMSKMLNTFLNFIEKVPFYGCSILCADNDNVVRISKLAVKKCITYGIKNYADFMAKNIVLTTKGSLSDIYAFNKKIGKMELKVLGEHNIQNALSVVALGMELGIKFPVLKNALYNFQGVGRRLEKLKEIGGVTVIDDYAHHPTEIKATLAAVKSLRKNRVIAVFQPHRYTRTKLLYREFGMAFKDADKVIVTNIYPAGEKPISGVSSMLIVSEIKKHGRKDVTYVPLKEEIIPYLSRNVQCGDLVIFLGAGDIRKTGEIFSFNLGR